MTDTQILDPMTWPVLVDPSVFLAHIYTGATPDDHVRVYKDGPWKADVAPFGTYRAGNVDWKGAGEVITWYGPASRYWFPAFEPPSDNRIYRNGQTWCSTRYSNTYVLGASIREVSGTKYLNVVTWLEQSPFGLLRVWTREFFDGVYANDDDYNATTNPYGWKKLYEDLYFHVNWHMGTPAFFNASGTECQFLIGVSATIHRFDRRYTIGISSSDVVTLTGVDNESVLSTTTSLNDSATSIISITTGTPDPTSPHCVAPTLVEVGENHDRLEFTWDKTRDTINETAYSTAGVAAVACDYIGDSPVYAYIEKEGSSRSESHLSSTGYTVADIAGGNYTGSTTLTESGTASISKTDFGLYLHIGASKKVALSATNRIATETFSQVQGGSSSYGATDSETIENNFIQYIDLRNNILIYTGETNVTTTSTTDTARTGSYDTTRFLSAELQGSIYDVFSHIGSVDLAATVAVPGGLYNGLTFICPFTNVNTDTVVDTPLTTGYDFWVNHAHPGIKDNTTPLVQSLAVSSTGVVFTCFEIVPYKDASGVSWADQGDWWKLDNADPQPVFAFMSAGQKRAVDIKAVG